MQGTLLLQERRDAGRARCGKHGKLWGALELYGPRAHAIKWRLILQLAAVFERKLPGRWPAAVNGGSSGFQGRSAPATQGNQYSWQRFASPSPYSSGRTGSGQSSQRGGWQGYSSTPRGYSGGLGGGSRPPLHLNRPIMRQRAPSSGYYGGGRTYSAPSGGGRNYSAPSGGSGHSSSAPHSSGGGGGHSSGGGHGGGRR